MKRIATVLTMACALALSACLLAACSSSSSSSAASSSAPSSAASASASASATSEPTSAASESASAAASESAASAEAALAPGIYTVKFDTDSSMFHINEALDGQALLTVENGEMTVHIVLQSKKITNLYPGLKEDAAKEGAVLLQPIEEEVTYANGDTEVVYAFDVPVPVLDEPFDLALIGEKGTWYDHKVTVSDPQPAQEER